ncbi:MAG TPA: glycosyltransferase [Gaiellaceae bacterium]|jgi:glycosyltransferase involved in cell wall biosynthesis
MDLLPSRPDVVYPPVAPVDESPRPFWSIMMSTRNRPEYLETALRSVLAEDTGPDEMQIEVVDDCSIDDVQPLVETVGGGRVAYFRHPSPQGLAGNFNSCLARARGHWVHLAHDDDIILPGFYARARALIDAHPELLLVFQKALTIDANGNRDGELVSHLETTGIVPNALPALIEHNFVCCPTAVVARDAMERVGGFAPVFGGAIDWNLWLRLAASGPIGYVGEPGLLYRRHTLSTTNAGDAGGMMMRASAAVIQTGVTLLPESERPRARATACRNYALEASVKRATFERQGRLMPALRNALWAFRLLPSAVNLARLLATPPRAAAGRVRRRSG